MLNVISLSFTFIERHREYLNSFVIMSNKKEYLRDMVGGKTN